MEEQRQRQEEEARRAAAQSAAEAGITTPTADGKDTSRNWSYASDHKLSLGSVCVVAVCVTEIFDILLPVFLLSLTLTPSAL